MGAYSMAVPRWKLKITNYLKKNDSYIVFLKSISQGRDEIFYAVFTITCINHLANTSVSLKSAQKRYASKIAPLAAWLKPPNAAEKC